MNLEIVVRAKDGTIKAKRGKRRRIVPGKGSVLEEINPLTARWHRGPFKEVKDITITARQ